MNPSRRRPSAFRPAVLAALALIAVACGEPAGSATVGPRPSTTATVRIVEPADGATIDGTSIHVAMELQGARIVPETTTSLRPDEGHLHLYLNGGLVSMNYGLEQDVPVQPGTYAITAEFVAADHAPFSPRVWTDETVVTVTP